MNDFSLGWKILVKIYAYHRLSLDKSEVLLIVIFRARREESRKRCKNSQKYSERKKLLQRRNTIMFEAKILPVKLKNMAMSSNLVVYLITVVPYMLPPVLFILVKVDMPLFCMALFCKYALISYDFIFLKVYNKSFSPYFVRFSISEITK